MAGLETSRAWHVAAGVVLVLAVGFAFRDLWREGPRRSVPHTSIDQAERVMEGPFRSFHEQDALFAAAIVSRNAYTLLQHPSRLYDAEHCAPYPGTLALGEPLLTMGLLATPAWLATRDPVLTYNLTLVALVLLAGGAMYLLVTGWTGIPAAGIAAGLLYAFGPERSRDVTHPFVYDTTWTLGVLWFGQRFFARGRWRDAAGLATCGALQLGASAYPALAAGLLLPPFGVWLVVHHGLRRVRVSQLLFVAASALAAVVLVYAPFLAEVRGGAIGDAKQGFAVWARYAPGGVYFPGWLAVALAAVGLLTGRRRAIARLDGDPRWALCAGALIAATLATTPAAYAALASLVPGLDAVRAPARIMSGAHLVVCLLAGLGAAALLRSAPRRSRLPAALATIALAALTALRPGTPYGFVEARPDPEAVAFFSALEERGNAGPILELPLYERPTLRRRHAARRILLSAWHHRPTSSCMASHAPPGRPQLVRLGRAVPDPQALAAVKRLGFTTLVVHSDTPAGRELEAALEASPRVVPLAASASLSAWAIDTAPAPDPPNLVLVIGDDHGWRDFGFMGSPHARTPHLDRLAAEGTVFRLGYTTASVCRPSLLSLLTSLDPSQYVTRLRRLERQAGRGLDAGSAIRSIATLPRILEERGYTSFQAGKHFEGSYADAGFDEGMMQTPRDDDERLARETLEPVFRFLEQRRAEPFFLWFAPKLPHAPHDPPPRFLDVYADAELPPGTRLYYANVTRLDAALGELLARLDRLGLRERTLVVFVADNGWLPGPTEGSYLWSLGRPKGKQSLHDAGFRTPLVFRWPERIPAGVVRDELVSTLDLFPTFLDYAGVDDPPERPGHSLRPLLEGWGTPVREALVGRAETIRADSPDGRRRGSGRPVPGGSFVRTPRWHLLAYDEREAELYDVATDPDETRNVAAEYPAVVRDLQQRIRDWRSGAR